MGKVSERAALILPVAVVASKVIRWADWGRVLKKLADSPPGILPLLSQNCAKIPAAMPLHVSATFPSTIRKPQIQQPRQQDQSQTRRRSHWNAFPIQWRLP